MCRIVRHGVSDEGNQTALERLADLADARGDLDELLDDGSSRAGHLLTRRALNVGDLLEPQRLSDAGCDEAGNELERLLARPARVRADSASQCTCLGARLDRRATAAHNVAVCARPAALLQQLRGKPDSAGRVWVVLPALRPRL
jgi:hypothetical protein